MSGAIALDESDRTSKLRHRTALTLEANQSPSDDKENQQIVSNLIMRSTTDSWQSLITSQAILCNAPILVLVLVASLDNADKQLLASSFSMLERTLHLDIKMLGYFSLFTNLSYALSLPLWGFLVHKYGMQEIHTLLSVACCCWGLATIGIAASGSSIVFQAIFRALNGVALGSILPLSQTLLMEMVDVSMRGRAFGFMGLCEKLAGTMAGASIVYFENWQNPYYILGLFSVLMAAIAHRELSPLSRNRHAGKHIKSKPQAEESSPLVNSTEEKLTLRRIVHRISKIPAFACLVAQGVFGGTPWDMMSFMLLLLDWKGFTKAQIVSIQFSSGVSLTFGGWIGGTLGDCAQQHFSTLGRISVAIVSVVGGIPLYGLFLYATDYRWAFCWINLFSVWAVWCQPAALRLARSLERPW
jgi:MFS family permease